MASGMRLRSPQFHCDGGTPAAASTTTAHRTAPGGTAIPIRGPDHKEAKPFPMTSAHSNAPSPAFAYDVPGVARPAPGTRPEASGPSPEPTTEPERPPRSAPAPVTGPPSPQAAEPLAALPHRDRRLLLSEREITALAPAVTDWLAGGGGPAEDHRGADRRPARTSHPAPGPPPRPPPVRPAPTAPHGPAPTARPPARRPPPELRRLRPHLPRGPPGALPGLSNRRKDSPCRMRRTTPREPPRSPAPAGDARVGWCARQSEETSSA